jgi:hypothetical protein
MAEARWLSLLDALIEWRRETDSVGFNKFVQDCGAVLPYDLPEAAAWHFLRALAHPYTPADVAIATPEICWGVAVYTAEFRTKLARGEYEIRFVDPVTGVPAPLDPEIFDVADADLILRDNEIWSGDPKYEEVRRKTPGLGEWVCQLPVERTHRFKGVKVRPKEVPEAIGKTAPAQRGQGPAAAAIPAAEPATTLQPARRRRRRAARLRASGALTALYPNGPPAKSKKEITGEVNKYLTKHSLATVSEDTVSRAIDEL